MANVRSRVGLDVHARSVLAVTIDTESGQLRSPRLSGRTSDGRVLGGDSRRSDWARKGEDASLGPGFCDKSRRALTIFRLIPVRHD
jgi:hypothetical protein